MSVVEATSAKNPQNLPCTLNYSAGQFLNAFSFSYFVSRMSEQCTEHFDFSFILKLVVVSGDCPSARRGPRGSSLRTSCRTWRGSSSITRTRSTSTTSWWTPSAGPRVSDTPSASRPVRKSRAPRSAPPLLLSCHLIISRWCPCIPVC